MEPIEHNNVMNSSSGGLIPLVELMNTTHTAGIIQPKVHNDLIKNVPVAENKTSTECLIDTNTSAYNNNFSKQNTVSTDTYKPLQGEITMAEVDTGMLAGQHADIRREAAVYAGETRYNIAQVGDTLNDAIRVEGGATRTASAAETNEIIKESIKGDWHNSDAIKDTRFDIATRMADNTANLSAQIDRIDDTTMAQFMTVARDTSDLRAQVTHAIANADKAAELNALRTQLDAAKNTTYLSDKIGSEGERTRALINDLKYNDLNRELIDRNTALIEAAGDGRYWRHRGIADQNQAQFASLQTQLQAFNSQLTETRQGMVNFGTMAGVGQSSTSNNVR